ncbi:hypothetical protein PVK06_008772 [Gossypium arboreum]|uniref:Galactose oxidase-like Early set domain-containing protein n=1 Tax=Gossypium arboreum TaxID=29729 RepID=A0ABR0QM33_GOSAR|nr:hypothetical protein PVK06_008772 [Gossypium arboreum]
MEIKGKVEEKLVWITMVAPAFNTHSFSMNQRLIVLGNDKITALEKSRYNIEVRTPRSGNLAPAGFYLLFVVHQDIPSMGIWVQLHFFHPRYLNPLFKINEMLHGRLTPPHIALNHARSFSSHNLLNQPMLPKQSRVVRDGNHLTAWVYQM